MTDDKHPRTARGKPVTEETIDRLAHEAEAGYTPQRFGVEEVASRWALPRRRSSRYVSTLS